MNFSIKARWLFILLLPLVLFPLAAKAETPAPADKVFTLNASREGALRLAWTVAPGAYLYRDSLKASLHGRDLALTPPPGETKDDPNFGEVEVYHDVVALTVPDMPPSGVLDVTYQGCAESGICYPPVRSQVDLASLVVTQRPRASLLADTADPLVPSQDAPQGSVDREAGTALSSGSLAVIPAFVGFGLLLAFTPCVFPMIPILSGILVGAGQRSIRRGFSLSAAYVLAMASAYGLAGLVAGWSGANLQVLLQTPLVLGLSAAIFVALALAMFGLFELALPSFIVTRIAALPVRGGSLGGAALIGFGSALVIGPCVTPPLAAAMLYAIDSGDAARGGAALFALGLGMGLPLVLAGTFGARFLPKAGPWLDGFHRLFGLIFLGVAVMLVARLLPLPAGLALWGAWGVIVATFLGAFDRLDSASPWNARLSKAIGLSGALYGAVLIVGAAGGSGDPLRPLAFVAGRETDQAVTLRLTQPADFDRAFAAEATAGKPVLILFTADWCTVCKSNEKILAEPGLRDRLARTPRISVDITAQTTEAEKLMARFRVIGPPALFLLDANGREIPGSRLIGAINAADLTARLAI
ncbi:Thiol:disulfide interchange protein DsbD [Pleomorphomonas sp. T1.2MG-36]|uniref:protein-disulfide reductase DsbD n=1 Tax=Pleomorphomonas sp. T1.2MG-36 TaxID=3041167 RepID=UPI0024778D56|nr:protein-disulfide reductase DsbD [Pleomorphomonas sp. T1.2MG-36]CAI9408823.1 Thiol:disulfide interchange protein DsbD [Pleomorphomonas sp. T1.2MG-36]